MVAALGPKNVELAAELAEGWEPIFYFPEKAAAAWGAPLAAGAAKRDPSLPPLDVIAQAPLAIGEDTAGLLDLGRPVLRAVHRRDGRPRPELLHRPGGAVRLPGARPTPSRTPTWTAVRTRRRPWCRASLLEGIALVGPESLVAERVAAMRESGVTTLNVTPLASTHAERVR